MTAQEYAAAMQDNMNARMGMISRGVDMLQLVGSQVITNYIAGQSSIVNFTPRNVGALKRFYVEIVANVQQGAAETQNLTTYGPANILSNITFSDLSNQQRINTTGWHLDKLATVRRQLAFGAAFTSDNQTGLGNNFNVMKAPAAVTAAANMYFVYEIPLAYSDTDLRGAIWGNILNATMNLALTINPNFFIASTGNPVQAVYKSTTAQLGKINSITINLYQNYLDQTGPQLPMIDFSTIYELKNTLVNGLAVNSDNPISYSNFRNFLSTMVIYDNAGVLNNGSDVNTIGLQSASFTNIFKFDPQLAALLTRTKINDDFPLGSYYFDHRAKPISTQQFGNMQLIFNPSAVTGATSQLLVGFESLALAGAISQAGSLFSN